MNIIDNFENLPPPPGPGEPAEFRREKMLAFQLGALEEDEMALIRGRLESDPEWKKAQLEAEAMLSALSADGSVQASAPLDLGGRTIQRLREAREGRQVREVSASMELPETRTDSCKNEPGLKVWRAKRQRPAITHAPARRPISMPFMRRAAAAIFVLCVLPVAWLTFSSYRAASESILWRPDPTLAARRRSCATWRWTRERR